MPVVEVIKRGKAITVQSDGEDGWWQKQYSAWENYSFTLFDTFLSRHSSYIDVGAWVGPTVLYAAHTAKHVYALEPDPVAFKDLQDNIALNCFTNVTAVAAALGDCDGESLFGGNGPLGNSESTLLVREEAYGKELGSVLRMGDEQEEKAWRSSKTVTVPVITIETFIKQYGVTDCTFMKIDIEGGEKIVIPAIQNFLRVQKPTLYLSLHWVYLPENEIMKIAQLLNSIYPIIYVDPYFKTRLDLDALSKEKYSMLLCMGRDIDAWTKVSGWMRYTQDIGRRVVRIRRR